MALAEREKEFGRTSLQVAQLSDLDLFLETLKDPAAAVVPLTKAFMIDQVNSDPELPVIKSVLQSSS